MTNKEFIDTICDFYLESRELAIDPKGYDIWRGVSHSVSSRAEDLFALFVAERLKDNALEFIVDKTFSFKSEEGKSIKFRPDLAIVRNNTITHIFDLKMDMGYKRRYFETDRFKESEKMFEVLRSGKIDTVSYREKRKTNHKLSISDKIINQIVVISEKNGGKASNRIEMIEAVDKLDWINLYYLTKEVHPNNYNDEKPVMNDLEFERLFKDIKRRLA